MPAHTHASHVGNKYIAFAVVLVACAASAAILIGVAAQLGWVGEAAPDKVAWPIALSSKRLDFGKVPIHGSVTRQLVVRNDGPDPVEASIDVDGTGYTINPQQLILHPGVSSRIRIIARADELGVMSDRLRIHIDDDTAPLVIALDGEVTDGSLARPADSRRARVVDAADDDSEPRSGETTLVAQANRTSRRVDAERRAPEAQAAPEATSSRTRSTPTPPTTAQTPSASASSRTRTPSNRNDDDDNRGSNSSDAWQSRNLGGLRITTDTAIAPAFQGLTDAAQGQTNAAVDGELDSPVAPRELPRTTADDTDSELPGFDDPDRDNDDRQNDLFDDDDPADDRNPFDTPGLKISGVSTLRLLGTTTTFYPQEVGVVGSNEGGPWALTSSMDFPQIPLAFGESMAFAQAGDAVGSFDPMSGTVEAQVPMQAIDNDGHAAVFMLKLTTGTALGRNNAGVVVSLSGSPRTPDSGQLRLVAIEKIPAGFRNGAEEHLVVLEILATLSFAPTTDPHSLDGFGRIGG